MMRVTTLLLLVLVSEIERGWADSQQVQQNSAEDVDNVLYPYGPAQGDKLNPAEDDGTSGEIPLSREFKFFGKSYKSLHVNNNGVISFNMAVSQYTPDPFPLTNGEAFVTPYWGDVDNDLGGNVWHRESTDPDLLHRISEDMAQHLPNLHFKATWAFVATWDKVAYYGSASKKVNTFQAVLTTDGFNYIAILNYGEIQWTTGTASEGDPETGLGGIPAQAGFNSGDETHYFNIPGSRTNEILNIPSTSNVNYPGRWVFQVDEFKVAGGCTFQGKFAKEGEDFWKEAACNTKCTCKDGKVCCKKEACPESTTCEASGSFFTCKIKDQEICY
ncbi:alpha-tectorin-like [Hyla sarda]|uniref:alpha-tectorin-like n=1 Tax=Hyla sarda TaxID=327740 RepID=UPI0024C456EB|nr:alpha-tectorin-like [Hyla sarda]